MGLVANPDTKHYISHDVFTYVSSIPKEKDETKFVHPKSHQVKKGDTIYTNYGYAILENISSSNQAQIEMSEKMEVLLSAEMTLYTLKGDYKVVPMYGIRGNQVVDVPAILEDVKLRFRFTGVDANTGTVSIETAEQDTSGDFIIMKAIVFPWINLVWAGTIVMVIGFLLAIFRRVSEYQRKI
jgi:cytochrome c-type biogenesis protein CcmF